MKNIYGKCRLLAAVVLMGTASSVTAQIITGDVFIKGDYVQLGMAPNGSFGSKYAVPAGYLHGASSNLGFIADADKDGWNIGSPAFHGDYVLPGSSQEGWGIRLSGNTFRAYRADGADAFTPGLSGSNTGYVDSGYIRKAVWEGSVGNLSIKQVTSLRVGQLYVTASVTIKNTGSNQVTGLYYTRTIDPANEADLTGDHYTDNKIVVQLPNLANKVLVQAVGTTYKAYLALGTTDSRARAYVMDTDMMPDNNYAQVYAGTGTAIDYYYDTVTRNTNTGMGLVYELDTLKSGDSTIVSYTYIFSPAYIDSAFGDLPFPLPLHFLSFEARTTARCGAGLSWSFNTDVPVTQFYVERSADGHHFETIARLDGQSTSFSDQAPAAGKWYYRVRAVTADAVSTYTRVVMVPVSGCAPAAVVLYPNPAQGSVRISTASVTEGASFRIDDMSGKQLISGLLYQQNTDVALTSLKAGLYVVRVFTVNGSVVLPLSVRP